MSSNLHQAPFKWPTGPSKVIVTGSFDNWSSSTELAKTDAGFFGTFDLPWDHKITYKYVVDGQWKTNPAEPQEPDSHGNINNVYTTPPKPVVSAPPPPAAPAVEKTTLEEAKGNAASIVSYVASGFGAAFASVTGIDPINPQQIPLEDDKAKEVLASTSVPGPDARKAEPAPTIGTAHDPLAPEAPVGAKKTYDALAPIADEPIVLPTTSTISKAATDAVTATSTYVTDAATAVKNILPTTGALENILPTALTGGKTSTSNGISVPDAVEPYKEPITSEPIPIPDAVDPYKATTNGTLPGEVEASSSKFTEAASKISSDGTKVSEAASKVKDAITQKTPPSSPSKRGTFADSEATESIRSGADGTPKRKKRNSILVKLKAVLTPEKKKHKLSNSVSS